MITKKIRVLTLEEIIDKIHVSTGFDGKNAREILKETYTRQNFPSIKPHVGKIYVADVEPMKQSALVEIEDGRGMLHLEKYEYEVIEEDAGNIIDIKNVRSIKSSHKSAHTKQAIIYPIGFFRNIKNNLFVRNK